MKNVHNLIKKSTFLWWGGKENVEESGRNKKIDKVGAERGKRLRKNAKFMYISTGTDITT